MNGGNYLAAEKFILKCQLVINNYLFDVFFSLASNSTTLCSLSFVTDVSLNSGHALGIWIYIGAVCSIEKSSGPQNPRVNWLLRWIFWIFFLFNNSIIFCIPSIIILYWLPVGCLIFIPIIMAYYNKPTVQNRYIQLKTSVLFTTLLHCNPVLGSTGVYREIPVMKTWTL